MLLLSLALLGSLFHSTGPMTLKDLEAKVFLSVLGMTSLSLMLLDQRVWVFVDIWSGGFSDTLVHLPSNTCRLL